MTSNHPTQTVAFEGEEAGAGYASPTLDLIASGFLLLLTIVVMVASWRLPVPGDLLTAPGLLPFLTALSLMLMALVHAFTAVERLRQSTSVAEKAQTTDNTPIAGTLILAGVTGLYILALQSLAFQYDFSLLETFFSVSAFEPVTIVALAAIIHIYWRGPLWVTTIISVAWTVLLSVVFQKAFNLPLPGSF